MGVSSGTGVGAWGLLRAFVWLRWRTQVNQLTSRRRSYSQRLGRVGELVARLFLAVGVVGGALFGAFLGFLLPMGLTRFAEAGTARGFAQAGGLLLVTRLVLALFLVLLIVVPAFRGMMGGGLTRTRLLLSPIRRRHLHALEAVAHLGDPWLLALVPGLLAVAASAVFHADPGLAAGAIAGVAGLLLVLAAGALSAAAGFGVALLLRDRRRAEALGLVLVLAWITVVLLPSWGDRRREREEERREEAEVAARAELAEEVEEASGPEAPPPLSPAEREAERAELLDGLTRRPYLLAVPSEAYARALGLAVLGRPGTALVPTGALALTTLLLFGLSRFLWERLVASPAVSGGRRGSSELPVPRRLPMLSEPASAVAWGQLRGLSRSLAGRLSLIIAPIMAAFLVFMFRSEVTEWALGGRSLGTAGGSVLLGAGAVGLSLLSVQNFLINVFALDGPGYTLSTLSPVARRELVLGKWVAYGIVAAGLMAVTLAVVAALVPVVLPWAPALLLGGLGVYCLLAPLGAWLSLLMPKAVDLGRLGKASQPSQLAGLIAMLAATVSLVLAVLVGFTTWALTRSVLAVTVVEGLGLAAAALLARLLLGPIARALGERGEEIYLALHERPDS